jgi:hypothetical protein
VSNGCVDVDTVEILDPAVICDATCIVLIAANRRRWTRFGQSHVAIGGRAIRFFKLASLLLLLESLEVFQWAFRFFNNSLGICLLRLLGRHFA